ncbi:hypothetical protein DFH11DRAFT_141951 [Phellopilus nigrolimitatus]|nr:hypothetical protein DFH11DRAFT_141951 [Phellopilus nigrolimitatus]
MAGGGLEDSVMRLLNMPAELATQTVLDTVETSTSSKIGRYEQALQIKQNLLAKVEALSEKDPDRFNPDLADCLDGMGLDLSKLGRHEEALEAFQRAVSIGEALAKKDPDRFNPGLANSFQKLGFTLGELGRHEKAFQAYQTAASIREAVEDSPLPKTLG